MGLIARVAEFPDWIADMFADPLRFADVALARERRAWHEGFQPVGTSPFPSFAQGWKNNTSRGGAPCGFMVDSLGVVHLRGHVTRVAPASDSPAPNRIFTLPASYRPQRPFERRCYASITRFGKAPEDPNVYGTDGVRVLIYHAGHGTRAGWVALNDHISEWTYPTLLSLDGIRFPSAAASAGRI